MIQVLYQSEEFCIVNKEAGWLSVAGQGEHRVLGRELEKQIGLRVWPVHRLDVETSGVILFALTAEAHRQASIWFERKQVKKFYRCFAQGVPARPVFKIQTPVDGAATLTQVEVLDRYGQGDSAVFEGKIALLTGKRHQIRIHLSSMGHPLLGDREYGGDTSKIGRVALHSWKLILPNGQEIEAPMPRDLIELSATLRSLPKGDRL